MFRFVGLFASILVLSYAAEQAKTTKTIVLENVEVGVADADQSTAAKLSKVTHPQKLSSPIVADHHHKLILKFAVKDKASGSNIKVHQAFVKLALGDAEIIYVAERDSSGVYKFDLDVNAKAQEFSSKSGTYSMSVIIGDAKIDNPLYWHLADIKFDFPALEGSSSEPEAWDKPKKEIKHMFREPEKRPPALVSTAFTVLCVVPFVGLILAWMKLGANISHFPFGLSSIVFHLGLGSIFVLYFCFWLQLNMFTSLKYLIMIGVVTFLCGNSLLVKIAEKRKNSA